MPLQKPFLQHLEIVVRPHPDALGLEYCWFFSKNATRSSSSAFDGADGVVEPALGRHVLVRRVKVELVGLAEHGPADRLRTP